MVGTSGDYIQCSMLTEYEYEYGYGDRVALLSLNSIPLRDYCGMG